MAPSCWRRWSKSVVRNKKSMAPVCWTRMDCSWPKDFLGWELRILLAPCVFALFAIAASRKARVTGWRGCGSVLLTLSVSLYEESELSTFLWASIKLHTQPTTSEDDNGGHGRAQSAVGSLAHLRWKKASSDHA